MRNVISPPLAPTDMETYFLRIHEGKEPLRPLGKACHDCAVACGFYRPYSAELSKLPRPFQHYIAARWFCHNHPDRACKGNIDYLDEVERNSS